MRISGGKAIESRGCRPWVGILLIVAPLCFSAAAEEDPLFPTPDILKNNVAFWKKIYTEISLTKGLLHDRDYPLIIYDTIATGKLVGRARTNRIRRHKEPISAALARINTEPRESWGPRENKIYQIFERYGAADDLAGADKRIRFQQGQKERYLEGLIRSGMWIDTIRTILSQKGIPERLAFLPHVESSFDPVAYSKVGAAGLWQFMRGTGKNYLTIDYLVDERRDPIAATYAAAQLLAYDYSQLGSWPLAITAYNHGLYGMKRAVANTGSRDIAVILQKHTSRSFQFASKNFYSCFLAASEIAANPIPYFGQIPYKKPFTTTDLKLDRYVKPKTICEQFDISSATLQRLNPALRPVVFQQQKQIPVGYTLHLPADISHDQMLKSFAAIPDSLLAKEPERPSYYRVRRGDNLYTIAYRLGTTASALAEANTITRMNRIYAGQVLQIPGRSTGITVATAPVLRTAHKPVLKTPLPLNEEEEETSGEETTPIAPEVISSDRPPTDSLLEIATATADTSPANYAAYRSGTIERFDAQAYELEVNQALAPRLAEIRVSVDETLGHYADWLKVPTWQIRRLNRMSGSSTIRIGSRVIIPAENPESIERFIKNRLEYHMALEEDFFSRYKVVDLKAKTIKRGETLWDICNSEEEIPLWLFHKYNKSIDLARLIPGSIVQLPVIDEKTQEDFALEALPDRGVFPAVYLPVAPESGPYMLLP